MTEADLFRGLTVTPDSLLQAINGFESKVTLWKSIHDSPGYAHQMELLAKLKSDPTMQELACKLLGWDQPKLTEMLATLSNELVLGDQVAASADSDVSLLEKFKGHPLAVKVVAAFLG
jgi:hypothetical protein